MNRLPQRPDNRSASDVDIPWAPEDELTVAGCCIATSAGAEAAHRQLAEGQFYDRTCGRIFAASVAPLVDAAEVPGHPGSLDTLEARIVMIAAITEIPEARIRQIEEDRPVMWDSRGVHARSIIEAADRRQLMRLADELRAAAAAGDRHEITRLRALAADG